jgi:Rod binding domain-containing protein
MSGTIGALPGAIMPAIRTTPAIVANPATGGGQAGASTDTTAQKFESMAIAQFLKPIFATMGKADAPFGGGSAEQQFQPFLIDAIAKSMEARGGLGLTPMITSTLAAETAKHAAHAAATTSKGAEP